MQNRRLHGNIAAAAVIIWLMFIWGQSMMPAQVSSGESMAILTALPVFMRGITEYMIRKAAHFIEYLILGILVRNAVRYRKISAGMLLFVGISSALMDETIQLFASGRSSQVSDVWLDFAGYCTGILLLVFLIRIVRKNLHP